MRGGKERAKNRRLILFFRVQPSPKREGPPRAAGRGARARRSARRESEVRIGASSAVPNREHFNRVVGHAIVKVVARSIEMKSTNAL